MANIALTYISGSNLYAIVKNNSNYVYNATLAIFELFDSINHTAGYYDIALTDDAANGYTATWPSVADADYTVEIYEYTTAATPIITDSIIAYQDCTFATTTLTINSTIIVPVQFRYTSLMEAEYYLTSRINTNPWDDATGLEKVQALIEATIIIERLAFSGKKTDEDQTYQFPRHDDTETPQDVKDACTEIAYVILDGVDIEKEQDILRVEFEAYADVKTAYNKQPKEHIQSGVPSRRAWDMLRPYLQPINHVTLSRIN